MAAVSFGTYELVRAGLLAAEDMCERRDAAREFAELHCVQRCQGGQGGAKGEGGGGGRAAPVHSMRRLALQLLLGLVCVPAALHAVLHAALHAALWPRLQARGGSRPWRCSP